jgi:hypothetical protein
MSISLYIRTMYIPVYMHTRTYTYLKQHLHQSQQNGSVLGQCHVQIIFSDGVWLVKFRLLDLDPTVTHADLFSKKALLSREWEHACYVQYAYTWQTLFVKNNMYSMLTHDRHCLLNTIHCAGRLLWFIQSAAWRRLTWC